jgi:hypothetical protein
MSEIEIKTTHFYHPTSVAKGLMGLFSWCNARENTNARPKSLGFDRIKKPGVNQWTLKNHVAKVKVMPKVHTPQQGPCHAPSAIGFSRRSHDGAEGHNGGLNLFLSHLLALRRPK